MLGVGLMGSRSFRVVRLDGDRHLREENSAQSSAARHQRVRGVQGKAGQLSPCSGRRRNPDPTGLCGSTGVN